MSDAVTFEPPGVGQWALDRSHYSGGTTPISQWLIGEGMAAGMTTVFAEIGVPARCISARFVHGFMYTRLIPLIGGDRPPGRLPPEPILKLVMRFLPAFRARTTAATRALTERRFVDVVGEWESTTRPDLIERNRRFQAVHLSDLDDAALDGHIGELLDHTRRTFELHFYLHGHDLGPIARYLHAAIGWGLDPNAATSALAGSSPSTLRPLRRLIELRSMLGAADAQVAALDDVRATSTEAATLLDEHLADHGHVVVSGYDITALTLCELPNVLLGSIRSAEMPTRSDDDATLGLRDQVPAADRATFDQYLADARGVMDMRDDNGPITVEWPVGLLRTALLEAGSRLVAQGRFETADHALELTPDEARSIVVSPPNGDEIARRATERVALQLLEPPLLLGPDEPEPPLEVMPKPLADLVAMVKTTITHMGMDGAPATDPYVGVGIGQEPYTGRVCAAENADDAIERLEPGDILVVRATSPAFNAVLSVAGAVVTANGGALSHAAVLARELGIPAIVGCSGALEIANGSTITVDPVAGRVNVS